MSKLKLNLAGMPMTGTHVTFKAPCDCSNITCLQIADKDYTLVDALCEPVTSDNMDAWKTGALITVCLDVEEAKAYVQNSGHFAKQSKRFFKSIATDAWNGSAAPYSQEIEVTGATAQNVIEVSLRARATAEQVKAYQALNLQDGGQESGKIVLNAFGTKNTIDVPICIIVRGDL